MAQNASAQILTLQQECIKKKDQEVLQALLDTLSHRVDKLSSPGINQERPQQMYSVSKNSTDTLMSSLIDSQSQVAASLPSEQQQSEQKKVENVESTSAAATSSQASGITSLYASLYHSLHFMRNK